MRDLEEFEIYKAFNQEPNNIYIYILFFFTRICNIIYVKLNIDFTSQEKCILYGKLRSQIRSSCSLNVMNNQTNENFIQARII